MIQVLVLDMSNIMSVDTSGIVALEELHGELVTRGIQLAIANPRWKVLNKLEAAKFLDKLGKGWIFLTAGDAVDARVNTMSNC
ncbi:low affinity sulfate transporter 3-like [Nicotiana tomentosiformis]|uniref:low affinity sulfate transporter 3-like n=1 Tax=Nicotiana tomentosiformis TaxID=4098 RepID=UPI0008783D57